MMAICILALVATSSAVRFHEIDTGELENAEKRDSFKDQDILQDVERKGQEERINRKANAGTQMLHAHVDWPKFESPDELDRFPEWKAYLTAVYGTSVMNPKKYPIDVSTFWLLYGQYIESSGLDKILNSGRPHMTGCPTEEGQMYWLMSGGIATGGDFGKDPEGSVWIYHKPPYKALPADSWVEIAHVRVPYEKTFFWMYWAPGSGVYYNLGSTEVYKKHGDAVKKHVPRERWEHPKRGVCDQCGPELTLLSKQVAQQEITMVKSFQFTDHDDMRCGNTVVEFLDLRQAGSSACMDGLAGGWAAQCACNCDDEKVAMTCSPEVCSGGTADHQPWNKPWPHHFNSTRFLHHQDTDYDDRI